MAGALSISPAPRVLVIADIRRALRVETSEFLLNPGGPFSLLPAGWTIRRGRVERVDVVLQGLGDVGEVLIVQPVEQLVVRIVSQQVLAVPAWFAGIETGVGQIQASAAQGVERGLVSFARVLETFQKQRLGFFRRRLELERPIAAADPSGEGRSLAG